MKQLAILDQPIPMSTTTLFLLMLCFFFLLGVISRLLTTFIHELGHAIPAMIISRRPVQVFIGSYGDKRNCLRIRGGLITVWIKYNPLCWLNGLCIVQNERLSVAQQIIYVLGGPVASVILAATACYLTFSVDAHGFLKLFFVIFFLSAMWDLIKNLIPHKEEVNLFDGTTTVNDGQSLKHLFGCLKYPKGYVQGCNLLQQNQFSEAADFLQGAIERDSTFQAAYKLAIAARILAGEMEKAWPIHQVYASKFDLNSTDLSMSGLIRQHLGQTEEAKADHDAAVAMDPQNSIARNNRGLLYLWQQLYSEALADFDIAISLDAEDAVAYCNRANVNILLDKPEAALPDIEYALEVRPGYAEAWRTLGLYYEKSGDREKALEGYQKAKALHPGLEDIDKLIANVQ